MEELGQVIFADNSSDDDSSDEEDLELLMIDTAFPETTPSGERLCLEDLSDFQCERLFRYIIFLYISAGSIVVCCICCRFDKSGLHRLAAGLSLPRFYHCTQGTKATGMEALLILLRRLSYPNSGTILHPCLEERNLS